MAEDGYIAAVDVGTTNIRCHMFDKCGRIAGGASERIEHVYPAPGRVEMSADMFWTQFVNVVKEAIEDCNCRPDQVLALGISTQRNTFITWDKETGRLFHNFVNWRDKRASDYCKIWNNSWTLKTKPAPSSMHAGATVLYWLTRNKRYLSASIFRVVGAMVTMRLLWNLDNISQLNRRASNRQVYFGCIETWLLWKLTGGKQFATEISLASATGLFDPYVLDYGHQILGILRIPTHILPPVLDTCSNFGECSPEIFGAPIPIKALAGDQQAAMFGCGCFERGDVKISLSTGTFLDMNTGNKPHGSIHGLIPIVGWKIDRELVFLAEGFSHDTGSAITWAHNIGLFDRVEDTSEIANSVQDTGGVFFVPAFSGLQAPVNDDCAACLFIGLQPKTSKSELVRAILESLAFRVFQIYNVMISEAEYALGKIRVCGGVSKNDFVCQLVSDLIGKPIERLQDTESSSQGIAFLTGLSAGFWESEAELETLVKIDRIFVPCGSEEKAKLIARFSCWLKAVQRSLGWYKL